jgi:hypothetical protein
MVDVLYTLTLNRTMKLAVIVLSGGRGMRKRDGEVNPTKVHCKHIQKCHNETPL